MAPFMEKEMRRELKMQLQRFIDKWEPVMGCLLYTSYVLNYGRTANQIFNSENSFISDSGSVMQIGRASCRERV